MEHADLTYSMDLSSHVLPQAQALSCVCADIFPGGPLKIEDTDMAGSRDLSSHVLPQTPSMQPPSWAPLSGTTDTPYYAGPQGSDLPISSPFQVNIPSELL